MPDFSLEHALLSDGFGRPAGVDEAGRGPLAGPVVAAAVILPLDWPQEIRLDDSKRLSEAQRETAFAAIRKNALAWALGVIQPAEIDRLNILGATLKAMQVAVNRLRPAADVALVDGNRPPDLAIPCRTVVRGDQKSLSIAAASILAKVVRDRLMGSYGKRYPQWGFERHKGYGTRQHLDALRQYGPSPIHRASFKVRTP